jgi:hypothetical protein
MYDKTEACEISIFIDNSLSAIIEAVRSSLSLELSTIAPTISIRDDDEGVPDSESTGDVENFAIGVEPYFSDILLQEVHHKMLHESEWFAFCVDEQRRGVYARFLVEDDQVTTADFNNRDELRDTTKMQRSRYLEVVAIKGCHIEGEGEDLRFE